MLKKDLCIFVVFVFALFLPVLSVSAQQSLSCFDLRDYNLILFQAKHIQSPPIADGMIGLGEYPVFSHTTINNGSFFTSYDMMFSQSLQNEEDYPCDIAISYDERNFYVAFSMTESISSYGTFYHPELGEIYSVTVLLGAESTDDPNMRDSHLVNEYLFASDGTAVGFVGTRILRSASGTASVVDSLSSLQPQQRENGYVDECGECWNAQHYLENVKLSLSYTDSEVEVVFEAIIPIGDVLQCVRREEKEMVKQQLSEQVGSRIGSFALSFSVGETSDKNTVCVSTAIPIHSDTPLKNDLLDSFEHLSSAVACIPSPLYLVGTLPMLQQTPDLTVSVDLDHSQDDDGCANENTAESAKPNPQEGLVTDLPSEEEFLEMLPDPNNGDPSEEELEEEKADNTVHSSLLADILTLISALFIFVAMLIFFVVLQKKENHDKNHKISRKKR